MHAMRACMYVCMSVKEALLAPGASCVASRLFCSGPSRWRVDQRYLPCPSAVAVGVVVELVHHDVRGLEIGTQPQRQIGQHLGGAAERRRIDLLIFLIKDEQRDLGPFWPRAPPRRDR